MIPTLSNGFLYAVHRHRQRWLTEREKRKVFLLTLAIFTVVTGGVVAWIILQ